MMTGKQYEESLRNLNFKVYLQGEQVKNPVDHPIIRPSMNSVKATYELAEKPEYEDLMTTNSHRPGKRLIVSVTFTKVRKIWSKKSRCNVCLDKRHPPVFSAV